MTCHITIAGGSIVGGGRSGRRQQLLGLALRPPRRRGGAVALTPLLPEARKGQRSSGTIARSPQQLLLAPLQGSPAALAPALLLPASPPAGHELPLTQSPALPPKLTRLLRPPGPLHGGRWRTHAVYSAYVMSQSELWYRTRLMARRRSFVTEPWGGATVKGTAAQCRRGRGVRGRARAAPTHREPGLSDEGEDRLLERPPFALGDLRQVRRAARHPLGARDETRRREEVTSLRGAATQRHKARLRVDKVDDDSVHPDLHSGGGRLREHRRRRRAGVLQLIRGSTRLPVVAVGRLLVVCQERHRDFERRELLRRRNTTS